MSTAIVMEVIAANTKSMTIAEQDFRWPSPQQIMGGIIITIIRPNK